MKTLPVFIRDAASLMFLEATQKNYGTSGDDANRFFDQAQRLANSTQDEDLRTLLGGTLSMRDRIIADLAKRGCRCRFRDAAHSFKSGARHKTVGTVAAGDAGRIIKRTCGFGEGCDLRLQLGALLTWCTTTV